jgi:hypothetical protein
MLTTKVGQTVFIHYSDFGDLVILDDSAGGRVEVPFSELARAALEAAGETVLLQGVLWPLADVRGLVGQRVIEEEIETLERQLGDPAGTVVFDDPRRVDVIRRWT